MTHLLGPFGIEPDDARQAQEDLERLRWVDCEACGGSGEIIRYAGKGTEQYGYNELCGACGGTGRDCVTVSPVECDDDQPE